jgi:predicted HD phosphohydrolase
VDVLESAIRIGKLEGMSGHDLLLLKIAALYHDAGMLLAYDGHEEASVGIVDSVLPEYGFKLADITRINNMIRATKLPQKPHNIMEMVLCDADLDYLGRDDFFMISHRLKLEWHERGFKQTLKEWYFGQIDFLSNHKYFTKSAIDLRRPKKIKNLREVEALFVTK